MIKKSLTCSSRSAIFSSRSFTAFISLTNIRLVSALTKLRNKKEETRYQKNNPKWSKGHIEMER
jgi:hypothetical protein